MKSNFLQYILLSFAGLAMLIALVMFAVFKVSDMGQVKIGPVIIWGTLSGDLVEKTFSQMKDSGITEVDNFTYVEKSNQSFDDELLRAIAEDKGPDLVILNEKQILQNKNRLITIPFESYDQGTFQNTFLEEASLLITSKGFLGFPLTVDPLVMYYNKNFLINNSLVRPPETWSEILALAPVMTEKDSLFNISQSTIALGSFDNISHAKDIMWALMLQAGNPVISRSIDPQTLNDRYAPVLTETFGSTLPPSHAAINFFTQFSNPNKTIYSWNRSLPNSKDMFLSGDLAFYIGYGSELSTIQRLNPNLSFDIALLPQSQNSTRNTTYGQMNILAIPRTSKNIPGATFAIKQLTSPDVQKIISALFLKSPVRRDLLSLKDVSNPYQTIIYKSAIMAQGVLEPDNQNTGGIIKELIDTVVSGQFEISKAIIRTEEAIKRLIN